MTKYKTTLDQRAITLIENYVETHNIQALLGLYESVFTARDRAEANVRAYLHEIKLLSDRFDSYTKANTGPKTQTNSSPTSRETEHSPRGQGLPSRKTSVPAKPKANIIDIEL